MIACGSLLMHGLSLVNEVYILDRYGMNPHGDNMASGTIHNVERKRAAKIGSLHSTLFRSGSQCIVSAIVFFAETPLHAKYRVIHIMVVYQLISIPPCRSGGSTIGFVSLVMVRQPLLFSH